MIKALLFDLDGTLVDTLPLYIQSYHHALKMLGFEFNDKEIVKTCFGKTEEIICQNLGVPEKTKQFKTSYFSQVENHYTNTVLFSGVKSFLDWTQTQKIKLAVISFAYTWYVETMVQKIGLNNYFDTLIGFDDVKKAKPDPEAVFLACEKLEVNPSEAIVIGDSKSDILMGNSAGSKTILFHPKNYKLFYDLATLKETNPNYIMEDFQQLSKLLI